jgi:hypothetical protein
MLKFSKPQFSDLKARFRTDPESVHECSLIDPTRASVDTSAARISEALALANRLLADRAAIARLGSGAGGAAKPLFGAFGYADFGPLCTHGIGLRAQDLGAFLAHHWGPRTIGWETQAGAPDAIKGKTGVVLFARVPGSDDQGHIDLWDRTGAVGQAFWNAKTIWFWQLS